MSNNKEISITKIKNDKYMFNLIKIYPDPDSPKKIIKKGLTIHKKTLEINELNEDCIDFLLANTSGFIESYANFGFINIQGVLCFVYASDKDTQEELKLYLKNKTSYSLFRINNYHYFILSCDVSQKLEQEVKQEFETIRKFFINEELYFNNSPYRFDYFF